MLFTPTSVKKVWFITFEYSGLIKVGGLGEAVRNMVRSLTKREIKVTVLMPSHGRHLDNNRGFNLTPINFKACGDRIGINGKRYHYCLGAEETYKDNARIIMFKGLDTPTGLIFDSWFPYSNVEEKAALLARAVVEYSKINGLPDLIHAHDWHSSIAAILLKDFAERSGYETPFVYTVHLSSTKCFPWHYISEKWTGLRDRYHPIWRIWRHELESYSDLWNSVGGCIEHFAMLESDVFTTVSWNYMSSLLHKYGQWLREKTFVIYNSTDWSKEEVINWLINKYGTINKEIITPKLIDNAKKYALSTKGWIEKNRSIFIVTGRLAYQKGFDIAVKAIDFSPSAALLILGLPVGDINYEHYLEWLVNSKAGKVMLLKGILPRKLYMSLHYIATALVMPSRWEPFGMSAIEAMAIGIPVIASAVGGLKEIVEDLRANEIGTGVLIPSESSKSLGIMMETFANIFGKFRPELIPDRYIRYIVEKHGVKYPNKVKKHCIERVNKKFRLNNVGEMLVNCYEKARKMAYYRAISMR